MTEQLKNKKTQIAVAAIAVLLIYSLFGGSSSPSFERTYGGDVLAKVDGNEVREEEIRERLDFITGGKGASINLTNIDDEGLKALAKEVYVQRLVLENALKSDVKKDKDFQNKLASLVNTVYKEKFLETIAKKEMTEEKIKKTYDELVAKAKNSKQYKVKHALFKTEVEAKAAKTKIEDGRSSLEDTARLDSMDKLSASKGGDLGYIFPDEFVKEFADAVKKAKQGEITGPVKTEFGYHILKVEDSKPAVIVAFDQAKPRIEKQLGSDAVRTYVEGISKDLDIKVVRKKEDKKDEAKDAKPAAGGDAAKAPAKAEEKK